MLFFLVHFLDKGYCQGINRKYDIPSVMVAFTTRVLIMAISQTIL